MNTTERKVKMLLSSCGKSQRDVAETMGVTQPTLAMKLKRDTLKRDDLEQIAKACGATYKAVFILDDGTEI